MLSLRQQRLETAAERDATGMLHRTTVAHTPSKIEFQTPNLRNAEVSTLVALIRRNYTNYTQRNVSVTYYNPETDSYLSGTFYMPDVQYTIYSIDGDTVMYEPDKVRLYRVLSMYNASADFHRAVF